MRVSRPLLFLLFSGFLAGLALTASADGMDGMDGMDGTDASEVPVSADHSSGETDLSASKLPENSGEEHISAADDEAVQASTEAKPVTSSAASGPRSTPNNGEVFSVYIIPIEGAISKPNLFILRRALKEAIDNQVDMVILDMDTPGGRVDYTLDMMDMLSRFDGITATYVNDDAISAGSFIAAATQEIYFSPRGKMGASAVIQGGGQEVPETARLKVESYLRANIRVMTENYPFRSDVIRAMLDSEFEFMIGDELIKPAGELLTLTASEAIREYGDPPHRLLASGVHADLDSLLDARFGPGSYVIRDFNLTYSEEIAKWMSTFAPGLMALGILLLFIEFKTPGFGFFGIGGLVLLAIFFASQYIAGLAGNEVFLIFALGVLLVLTELLLFPGTVVFGVTGVLLMLGSLFWALVDVWPGTPVKWDGATFGQPLLDFTLAMGIALFFGILLARMLPGSFLENRLVLATSAGGDGPLLREQRSTQMPKVGETGLATTDLFPNGRVEIGGKRYEARSSMGTIERGTAIRVVRCGDFDLIVETIE